MFPKKSLNRGRVKAKFVRRAEGVLEGVTIPAPSPKIITVHLRSISIERNSGIILQKNPINSVGATLMTITATWT